jgi:hypothetical protein
MASHGGDEILAASAGLDREQALLAFAAALGHTGDEELLI